MLIVVCPECNSDDIDECSFSVKCNDCGHEDGLAGFDVEKRYEY